MVFRRAEFKDRERILEICSTVWDGHDYMPNIIDNWLADKEGELTVMVEEDQVMGLGKMTMVGPKTGWLEGLRVAPEARSRGFAKKITQYYIDKGRRMGLNQLNLSTYFENHASIHVTESNGFERVAEFFECEQKANSNIMCNQEVIQVSRGAEDYSKILEMFLQAPEQKSVKDFLGYGWLFKQMTKDLIVKEIEKGNIYYLKNGGDILGGVLIYPDHVKDKLLYIPLITGTDQAIANLLDWTHSKAIQLGFDIVGSMVPEDERLKSIYLERGFTHWDDSQKANVYVYQLYLAEGDE